MRSRRLVMILTSLVWVIILVAGYYWGSPHLLSVSPAENAGSVAAGTQLRLVFSRPMQADSVMERLVIDPAPSGSFRWEGKTLIFTPSQPWPAGQTIRVLLKPGGRAAGFFSLPFTQEVSWSFTIGQPRLVYLYPADGAANLYIHDFLANRGEQLTDSLGGITEFQVNWNGTVIYYSMKNSDGGNDLYRLVLAPKEAASSDQKATPTPVASTRVLACQEAQCRAPQISPAGDFLAYERTAPLGSGQPNYPQIWLLPLSPDSARNSKQSATPAAPILAGALAHQTLQPIWSPNGLLTFYDSSMTAFVILDPKNGQSVQFSNQTGQPGAWDPTGQYFVSPEISYISVGNPNLTGLEPIANSHLIRYNRLDKTTQDLSIAENLEDALPVYSPDGSLLAFARKFLDVGHWTPGRQLWIMRFDGREARQLTNDPYYNHFEFAWNPDGHEVAFVRFNQTELTEPPELWTIKADGSGAERLVVGGYAPQWIP